MNQQGEGKGRQQGEGKPRPYISTYHIKIDRALWDLIGASPGPSIHRGPTTLAQARLRLGRAYLAPLAAARLR
jgi:hypothetical protein